MSAKTRFTLFIICFLIFIIGAPSVILYSRGYRFDIENRELTKTGGFFIEVEPTRTDIYLDGKREKRTDLFFGSSFIKNLLPKKYNIELAKEGYYTWQKNLEVTEQTVTEINNVTLIPKEPTKEKLNKEINKLWFLPNKTEILLKESKEDKWELKLYDLNQDLKSHLIAEDDFATSNPEVATSSVEILELKFGPNSQNILFKLGIREQVKYFVLTIDPFPPKQKEITKLKNKQPGKIIFNPTNTNELLFKEDNHIYKYNIENENITYYYPGLSEEKEEIVTFAPTHNSNNLTYLTSSGFIYNSYPGEKINEKAFEIKKETEYILKDSTNFAFLLEKDNGKLYAINKEEKEVELLDKYVNSFHFSPHRDKLAYNSDHEIKIFYLRDQASQPFNKKGDKVFISRFASKIDQLNWLNNFYLVFKADNSVKITETDTRDKINIINLLDFEKEFDLNWSFSNKDILIYIEKELFRYSLPTF